MRYLDALKALGASSSTKIVFPMEFTNLLKPLIGNVMEAGENDAKKK